MKKTNLLKNFLRGIFGATLLTILFSGAAHAQTPTVDGTITETSYTNLGTSAGGGGSNVFLNTNPNAAVAGNPANSSNTQGFEVRLSRSGSGAGTNLQVNQSTVRYFAAYTSDGGFLSNQFISRANSGDGNYGSGAVNFAAAAPNPVDFNVAANFTVTNTADSGAGSLRQAILDANATVGTDTITFNISGATTIQPASELPPITDPVTIDGYTQSGAVLNSTCGGTATLQIVLNGASAGVAANGLTLGTGSSGSTVRALVINGFDGNGIEIGSSNNQIQGNFIGTSQNGAMAIANNSNGIAVISGTGNTSAEFPPRQPPLPLNGATSFRATAEAVSSSTV